ncbi:MAG: hypothetical protein D6675_14535 [Gemmatimonadetes bacterium]|nr:MAG: hypothetical protein D6675_14535 [Gemmatimonadota bacterium]
MTYQKLKDGFIEPVTEPNQYLVFAVGHGRFCLPLMAVSELLHVEKPRRLPGTLPHVMGVIAHRERVFPVLDLRRRLGMNVIWHYAQQGMLLEDPPLESPLILVVDRVFGATTLPPEWRHLPEQPIWGIPLEFMEQVIHAPDKEDPIVQIKYNLLFHPSHLN